MSGTVSRGQEAGRQEMAAVTAQQTGPRRRRAVVTVAAVVVVAGAGAAGGWYAGAFGSHGLPGPASAGAPPPATQAVTREDLSATTPVNATLGYAGSYTVTGKGGGTLTWLPQVGQVIGQGQVLYKTGNGSPVVLLYGAVPDWRPMSVGTTGADVSQLNHDLVRLGDADSADIAALGWDYFSWETRYGVQKLEQYLTGLRPSPTRHARDWLL